MRKAEDNFNEGEVNTMKNSFVKPEVEVVRLNPADIITSSTTTENPGNGNNNSPFGPNP